MQTLGFQSPSPGNVLKPRLGVINTVNIHIKSPQSIYYIRYKKLNFIPSLTTVDAEAPEKKKKCISVILTQIISQHILSYLRSPMSKIL
jgi:hypothetical protein